MAENLEREESKNLGQKKTKIKNIKRYRSETRSGNCVGIRCIVNLILEFKDKHPL